MRLLSAGAGQKEHIVYCKKYKTSKLYSILLEKRYIDKWAYYPDSIFMVDSGAHSWNKTTINKVATHSVNSNLPDIKDHLKFYKKYLFENRDKKYIFVEVDVYGVLPKKIIDDFYYEINSWKKNFQFIRVYHPIIDGGSLKELKKWINEGQTYIGIGNDSTHLLNKIFLLTRDKVKIHGFAMIKDNLLAKYPFYSADSTQALSTVMFGVSFVKNKMVSKAKMVKNRHPDFFHTQKFALENAIKSLKEKEKYYTALWKKRGIVWKD